MTSWFTAWFTRWRRAPHEPRPTLAFGFRGEGITWRLGDRTLEIEFTYGGGPRIYVEGIARWRDGTALTTADRERVFRDVVRFVKSQGPKPTVVVNRDDPAAPEWERLCAESRRAIAGVEHTSDEEQFQFMRGMYLGILQAGKGLTIDDTHITTERELDDYLRPRRKARRP